MNISIDKIKTASDSEWDQLWENCDYATYFHSREWAIIWNKYTRGRISPRPDLIFFSDGKRALLPLSSSLALKGLVRTFISSAAGTYGGWISNDNLTKNHAVLLVNYLMYKKSNLFWRINPFDPLVINGTSPIDKTPEETNALNLTGGFDSIYCRWSKGHRSAARKALKEGVSVRIAEARTDWNAYYNIYLDSLERWGENASSSYSMTFFDEIYQNKSPNIKLWLACYNDIIIAGALCLYAKKHVVYWHGAAYRKYFVLRPVNLLMFEAIKHACDGDYYWFDFNPSGGHEGVKAFKKNFGTQALSCPYIEKKSKVITLLESFSKCLKAI